MRIALFGSPAFALPVLDVLQQEHELVAVVTQPAKPVGRGLKLKHPPLAERALEMGIEVMQPERLRRNGEFADWLRLQELDVAVTTAYGKILPQALLDIPTHGFLNVHASLLPRWRGAAPVQWSLISGDTVTGVSIMQTEAGLDTGPVRLRKSVSISPDETAPELFGRLAELGAEALREALRLLAAGQLPLELQDDAQATIARLLKREDGLLQFSGNARESFNRYRGVFAWPGTYFRFSGTDIKVHSMSLLNDLSGPPGRVMDISENGIAVSLTTGGLLLEEVQSPGRKRLSGFDWANGAGISAGAVLQG